MSGDKTCKWAAEADELVHGSPAQMSLSQALGAEAQCRALLERLRSGSRRRTYRGKRRDLRRLLERTRARVAELAPRSRESPARRRSR